MHTALTMLMDTNNKHTEKDFLLHVLEVVILRHELKFGS